MLSGVHSMPLRKHYFNSYRCYYTHKPGSGSVCIDSFIVSGRNMLEAVESCRYLCQEKSLDFNSVFQIFLIGNNEE